MNILVIAKLSQEKLLSKLRPFVDNPQVEHLYLLRDESFLTDEAKIQFLPLPKKRGLFRHLEKIRIARKFAKTHQIDIVLSYLLTPHGYMGWIISRIIRARWIHAIIAGHREVWIDGRIMESFNLFVLRSADIVNVMGHATKGYLKRNGIHEQNIAVIPNAIDGKVFVPPTNKVVEFDIIYASRIDENKNFPLLIRAVKRLKSDFPNLKICVAGDGDKLDEAKKQCKQYGLDNNFIFIGKVDHDKIKEFYYKSNIFVLTSRGEGVPMALLEAMFCGLACISTNVGEIGSIIDDGENGFLLQDTEDDIVFADCIRKLLTNEKLREVISEKATHIMTIYSYNNVMDLWNETLCSLQSKRL